MKSLTALFFDLWQFLIMVELYSQPAYAKIRSSNTALILYTSHDVIFLETVTSNKAFYESYTV